MVMLPLYFRHKQECFPPGCGKYITSLCDSIPYNAFFVILGCWTQPQEAEDFHPRSVSPGRNIHSVPVPQDGDLAKELRGCKCDASDFTEKS